jgi:hypothetical protein
MTDMEPKIDWTLTTWEGSRREQLRRWRALSLRDRFRAIEDMAEISQRLQEMRKQPKTGRTRP